MYERLSKVFACHQIFFYMKSSYPFILSSLFIIGLMFFSGCIEKTDIPEISPTTTIYKSQDSNQASQRRTNDFENYPRIQSRSTIQILDSDWSTSTSVSDCINGLCDDVWELTLTQKYSVAITIQDCCCPGDFYELYINQELIGTTPNLSPPWGCDFNGELSSGTFVKTLCPGTYTIVVRDAGFDGHSETEIEVQGMCNAGLTVSGVLTLIPNVPPSVNMTYKNTDRKAEFEIQDTFVVNHLLSMLRNVEPFIISNNLGLQELQSSAFNRNTLTTEEIEFAQKIISINNRIIEGALKGEEVIIDGSDFEFIEPLFLYFAERSNEQCGTRRNPDPCPDRIESGQFFCMEGDVIQHLLSLGYHKTAGYACGFNPYDYTLVIEHPCGHGRYRSQAIVDLLESELWTYNTQRPEPNPEILSYIPPYASWPGYVNWWHRHYC